MNKNIIYSIILLTIVNGKNNNIFKLRQNELKEELYNLIFFLIRGTLINYHYKKNVIVNSKVIFTEFLNYLDNQKIIFTKGEFEDYLVQSNNLEYKEQISLAFTIYTHFKEKSLKLLEIQIEEINKINNIEALNTSASVYIKINNRFNEDKHIFEYQKKIVKSILIDLYLKNEENLDKAKEKLINRLNNIESNINIVSNEEIFKFYINTYTKHYDPHTIYFTPNDLENFNIDMKMSLEGIGAQLSLVNGITVIVKLIKGGPAEKSNKLYINDKIIGVGDSENDIKDIIGLSLNNVVKLIRGKKDTVVYLKIERLDKTHIVLIKRDKIVLNDQRAKGITAYDIKIGVIELKSFYSDYENKKKGNKDSISCYNDVKDIIIKFNNNDVNGIIFDMRSNGGGDLNEVLKIVGLFIGNKPVIQVKNYDGRVDTYNAGVDQLYNGNILILVDKLSASATEILAGAIQDYNRGLIVGSQTFGKGTVQTILNLNQIDNFDNRIANFDNSIANSDNHKVGSLKFTIQKFYRVSGQSTQKNGIIPDIELPLVFDSDEFGEQNLDHALSNDFITALDISEYPPFLNIEELKTKSKKRSEMDNFIKYFHKIEKIYSEEKKNDKILINLNKKKKRKEEIEKMLLEIENDYRKKAGLSSYLNYESILKVPPKSKEEIVLKEAARILIDYIALVEFSTFPVQRDNNVKIKNFNDIPYIDFEKIENMKYMC